jgi:hypothetical protein
LILFPMMEITQNYTAHWRINQRKKFFLILGSNIDKSEKNK